MIYELVICVSIIAGNCVWQATPQPSEAACWAVVAAILEADREARRMPPKIIYCRASASAPAS